MKNLYLLEKYFTTGTAEAEGNILADAFVPLKDYLEIINPPYASPRLIVGKKGSGKSAFMTVLKSRMDDAKVPALLLKPEDITFGNIEEGTSIGEITKQAIAALVDSIAGKLGTELDGLLTSEDDITLEKYSEKTGRRGKDFVEKALQVLGPLGASVSKIDFEKMAKDFGQGTGEEVKRAVIQNLGDNDKVFYLLIDDTDQVAAPSEPSHLNRIWAFILGARSLSQRCTNLRCIVSLRTEIWTRLERDDAGQRDQVDHFRNLLHWLNPTENEVANIVERRLRLAIKELEIETKDIYGPFFEGHSVTIPTTIETRSWRDFIVKRSRERPRDAVQLIALLLKTARKAGADKVDSSHVSQSMVQYSEERVEDLKREVDDECSQIKEIVRSFASAEYKDGAFTMDADSFLRHLKGLPSRFGISLLGKVLKPGTDDSTFRLWKFLFDIGLFAARKGDVTQEKGYTHVNARDDLDLATKPRWNDIQKYAWEINPAYRDFLLMVRQKDTLGIAAPSRHAKNRKKKAR